jgi:hypothetical protein
MALALHLLNGLGGLKSFGLDKISRNDAAGEVMFEPQGGDSS